jgi:hypothetical protein
VELDTMVEEMEERFGEVEVEEMVEAVRSVLGVGEG